MTDKQPTSRSRRLWLILGFVGCGKTGWLAQRIKAITARKPGEKILIMVKSNPPALDSVLRLKSLDELKRFCAGGSGVAKFFPFWDDSRYKEENALAFLSEMQGNGMPRFNNGVFIVDDGTGWLHGNIKREVKDWITNYKNFGVDFFVCFHDMNMVPPYIRSMATDVCLFKTGNDMEGRRSNYMEKYEKYFAKLFAAWKKVEAMEQIPGFIKEHICFETGVGVRNF